MVIAGLAAELLGGAALGGAFGVLLDAVRDAIHKSTAFKSLHMNIDSTLQGLDPVIRRISDFNVELALSQDTIRHLKRLILDGAELVKKSKKVSKWNCRIKCYYSDQLVKFDESLKREMEVLKMEGVGDTKETLILARQNNHQLIESAKDGKKMTRTMKRLLNRMERRLVRLVPACTHKETSRRHTGNKVLKASRSRRGPSNEILGASNLRIFRLAELKAATGNFQADVRLGKGRFGMFFKGWVNERTLAPSILFGTGMTVAVNILYQESMQGAQEWESEVNFLGKLSQPNLVKLLGYCDEEGERLLVYEFMQNGSLQDHLFEIPDEDEPLSWENRIKIAVGAAQGLNFLHSLNPQIIHRHVKPSCLLLDENYNTKLSDLYLTKWGPYDESSRTCGTLGYDAPEYFTKGHLDAKSDVYSFGVVLLQILTGIDLEVYYFSHPEVEIDLVYWATPLLSDVRKLQTIMDPRIKGQYSSQEALQTAHLTLNCLEQDPKSRPSMKEVVEKLESIWAVKEERNKSQLTTTHSSSFE